MLLCCLCQAVETIIVIIIVIYFNSGCGMVLHFFAGGETLKEGYLSVEHYSVAVRTDTIFGVTVICDGKPEVMNIMIEA